VNELSTPVNLARATIVGIERQEVFTMDMPDAAQDIPRLSPVTKRHVRRRIYLPFGIGLVAVIALVIGISLAEFGNLSVWADFSVVMLFCPAFLLGLLFLVPIAFCAYAVYRLIILLLEPLGRARAFMARAAGATRRGGDVIARPIFRLRSFGAAIGAIRRSLSSIFSDPQG
jgi:hypothetical protein